MSVKKHKSSVAWKPRRVAVVLLLFLVVALAGDYALYPHLAGVGGRSWDRGENGLWLRYTWYFGRRSDEEARLPRPDAGDPPGAAAR